MLKVWYLTLCLHCWLFCLLIVNMDGHLNFGDIIVYLEPDYHLVVSVRLPYSRKEVLLLNGTLPEVFTCVEGGTLKSTRMLLLKTGEMGGIRL